MNSQRVKSLVAHVKRRTGNTPLGVHWNGRKRLASMMRLTRRIARLRYSTSSERAAGRAGKPTH